MTPLKVLITGSGGLLGAALARSLHEGGLAVVALDRAALDVTDAHAVSSTISRYQPSIVIQCAAFTRVDDAESNSARAHEVNAQGTQNVARACAANGARLVYPSTDYVFDGNAREPYAADAVPSPANEYGRSKYEGENAARNAGDYLIVRTSWLYGPDGRNFVRRVAHQLRAGLPMRVVDDQRGSPTWTVDLAARMVALVSVKPPSGVYHLTNAGAASWYELAAETARAIGVAGLVTATTSDSFATPARRPAFSVLDNSLADGLIGPAMRWQDALARAIERGLF